MRDIFKPDENGIFDMLLKLAFVLHLVKDLANIRAMRVRVEGCEPKKQEE